MYKYLFLILPLLFANCNNDDDQPADPIDQLPPATKTGAGTFGCLVNGEPFIDNSGAFNCYYQLVNGKYYFGIGAEDNNINPQNIYLNSVDIEIVEGMSYQLLEKINGNAFGGGGFTFSPNESYQSYTNSNYTGELKITKFDLGANIVSGTFWFDIKHPTTNETVKIREGRFDSHFTQ